MTHAPDARDPHADPPPPALRRGPLPKLVVPASGPSGLSDYAVSPLGMRGALLGQLMGGEVRVAVLCRMSTEDLQDPRQSVMRQVHNVKSALPEAWVIVAYFYDVESGRLELDQRGLKTGYERFNIPVPRDGGIADLLAEAAVRRGDL